MNSILFFIFCCVLVGMASPTGSAALVGGTGLGGRTELQPSEAAPVVENFSAGPASESPNDAANAAARKFEHLKTNATKTQPDERPTRFTEYELNSYLASGKVKLPVGVRSVHFVGTPGIISGKAEVDFDAITAGKRSSNPLLSLFSGVHQIEASAHAEGEAGEAQIHVDAVSLDGVTVPSMAVEFFLERYLKSKHPEAGMNPSFKMSKRIDSALVGQHMLVIIQK
jgi:hypothetical protein